VAGDMASTAAQSCATMLIALLASAQAFTLTPSQRSVSPVRRTADIRHRAAPLMVVPDADYYANMLDSYQPGVVNGWIVGALAMVSTHLHRTKWGYVTSEDQYYDSVSEAMDNLDNGNTAPLCAVCEDVGDLTCRRCFGSGFVSDAYGEPCRCTTCDGVGITACTETDCVQRFRENPPGWRARNMRPNPRTADKTGAAGGSRRQGAREPAYASQEERPRGTQARKSPARLPPSTSQDSFVSGGGLPKRGPPPDELR